MSRALFVGQQPVSYEAEQTGDILHLGGGLDSIIKMMNIPSTHFLQNFDYINVSAHHEPDGLSPEYHRTDIRNIRPLLSGRRIILFGPQVASAFEIDRSKYEWCQFIDHPTWDDFHGLFCVIPHPSSRNPLYANPEFRGMVLRTLDMLWQIRDEQTKPAFDRTIGG